MTSLQGAGSATAVGNDNGRHHHGAGCGGGGEEPVKPGELVSIEDFLGPKDKPKIWTAFIVEPFEDHEPPNQLPGLAIGDEISLEIVASDNVRRDSVATQCEQRTSTTVLVLNRTKKVLLGKLAFDERLREFNGFVPFDIQGNRGHLYRGKQVAELPFLLSIKFVGQLSREVVDKGRRVASQQKLLKDFDKALPDLDKGFNDALFTWTSRFKHMGGSAHASDKH